MLISIYVYIYIYIIFMYIYIYTQYIYTHIWYIWKYVASILRWSRLFQPCPAAGTFEMAAKPLGTSANFKPADGDK